MKIERIVVGYLRCNTYVIDINSKVLVIDPGASGQRIDKLINGRLIKGIIVTHHHDDHDGAVNYFKEKYGIKIYDKNNLPEGINRIDEFSFEVIYTPGHKDDLISIYFKNDKAMFVGDFIFKDSIGRCDLDGGSVSDMFKSIQKIRQYDRNIILYPGHGDKTTLGYEMDNNPYFSMFM